jgi:hypothetical protein
MQPRHVVASVFAGLLFIGLVFTAIRPTGIGPVLGGVSLLGTAVATSGDWRPKIQAYRQQRRLERSTWRPEPRLKAEGPGFFSTFFTLAAIGWTLFTMGGCTLTSLSTFEIGAEQPDNAVGLMVTLLLVWGLWGAAWFFPSIVLLLFSVATRKR